MPDELTIDITAALVRHDGRTLVRIEREPTAEDRWVVGVDRARRASGLVPERVVDGWQAAYQTAQEMARAVLEHEGTVTAADRALATAWPRFREATP